LKASNYHSTKVEVATIILQYSSMASNHPSTKAEIATFIH
jgi:hypothetical protein